MTDAVRTLLEPARQIRVRREVDVLVCGGGVSGTVAALAAARQGASVALIEHHGFLGGTNSASHVSGVGGWQYELDGRPLIAGLPLEVMARATALDGTGGQVDRLRQAVARPNYRDGGLGCFWIRTNPELVKSALDALLAEAGVHVLLHASAAMPILDGPRIRGVFVESKSGREALLARVVVDCTGDGDIAARAGAPFAMGRAGDGVCQPMSQICTVGRMTTPALWYRDPKDDPEQDPLRRNRFAGAVRLARERGELVHNPNDLFCSATPLNTADPQTFSVNFTRVQGRAAIDADAMTQAEVEGRLQAQEAVAFIRKYIPGSTDAYLVCTAPQIGVRESRRILGDAVLTGDHVRGAADFADVVARGIYLLDIHNPSEVGKPSVLTMLDAPYSIPYRALVPRAVEGLLVAGRCISGDEVALASYRIQSHAMAIGQAAGTAAALAAAQGTTPRLLDIEQLQRTLLSAGANLGMRFR